MDDGQELSIVCATFFCHETKLKQYCSGRLLEAIIKLHKAMALNPLVADSSRREAGGRTKNLSDKKLLKSIWSQFCFLV